METTMVVPKWFKAMHALVCLLLIAAVSAATPARQEAGDRPYDSVAVATVNGMVIALDENGALLDLDASDVALLDSDVRAVVETDTGAAFLLLGAATAIEPTMAKAVAALPAATVAPTIGGTAADVHPRQPVIKFDLEKKWTDEKGLPRVRKGTLEVEKRSGESTEEHIERAERELEKWEKKGWSTV